MTITDTEIFMTRDEIAERIEAGSRERLGISGRELLDRSAAGGLDDFAAVEDLLILGDLLASDDPLKRHV